ncbi:MAG: hypothetical protein ACJ762_06890 [Solirubrobacteraceae bacterium]
MRSHRLATITVLVAATACAAGCGSGRDSARFMPDEPVVTPSAQAATAVPQVVVAAPAPAPAVGKPEPAKATPPAAKNAKAADRRLREERAKARRAHRRAAAREARLRDELAAARQTEGHQAGEDIAAETPTPPVTRPAEDPPISASDTSDDLVTARNRRSDAEARAAVIRFHELLDRHDPASCALLTERLLTEVYGSEDPLGRCAAAAQAISARVSVVIAESRAYGRAATIAVVTTIGDQAIPQTLRLVLTDGTWRLDAVERRASA